MTFEEWCVKKEFFGGPDDSLIKAMRLAWKAAQEDMRERAAFVCQEKSELRIYAEYENILEQSADEIRALPIEV